MNNQLNGKIYWVKTDFNYTGQAPLKGLSASSARISNCIIDDNMVKFYTQQIHDEGHDCAFNVNLLRNETGNGYTGTFNQEENNENEGEVTCEVFSNETDIVLMGSWLEEESQYTWWAKISKS